jgi:hypothetical protein
MKINGVEFIQHHNYHPLRGALKGGMIITTTNSSGGTDLVKRDKNNINNIIERRPFNLSTPQSVIEDYITYGDNTFNAVDDEDEKNLETHNKLRNLDNSLKLYDSMKKYTKKSGKPMPNINWMALDFAPTMKTNKVVKSEKKIKESKLIEAKEKLKPIPQPNQTVQVYKPPTSFKLPSSTEVQNSLRLLTGGDYGKKFEDYIEKQKELLFYLNGKQSIILNNDRNTKLSQIKNIKIGGKLFSEADLYLIDFSLDNSDIELKYWNTNQYKISFDKREIIKMHYNTQTKSYDKPDTIESIPDGIPLQESKILGTDWFAPLFINIGTSTNPKYKLYNVYDKKKNKFINDNHNKDYYILMCVKEGFYKYKVNDDLDLEYKALPSSLQGESGEQLFRLKNKKYSTDPKHIYIPYNKWEKINL